MREAPQKVIHRHEKLDPRFERYVADGVSNMRESLKKRFESNPDPYENLPYHNSEHTDAVVSNFKKIADVLGFTPREKALGVLIAQYHDDIQAWDAIDGERELVKKEGIATTDGKIMRKRAIGQNEKDSYENLKAYMLQCNEDAGEEIFTAKDISEAEAAIMGTEPSQTLVNNTVVQPNITEYSPRIARALALADLGTAGIEGPEAFMRGGDALFREENLDILSKVQRIDTLSGEEKEACKGRMVGWSKFQSMFAEGRQSLLKKELNSFSAEEQGILMSEVFTQFDDSIKYAREIGERRAAMAFEEIAKDMGYEVSNGYAQAA